VRDQIYTITAISKDPIGYYCQSSGIGETMTRHLRQGWRALFAIWSKFSPVVVVKSITVFGWSWKHVLTGFNVVILVYVCQCLMQGTACATAIGEDAGLGPNLMVIPTATNRWTHMKPCFAIKN